MGSEPVSNSSFYFCSLFYFLPCFCFQGGLRILRVLGVFTFSGGNRCGGVACFAAAIFLFFLCRRVLALVFALEEGGGGYQLKSSVVAFPLVVCSDLLIDTLNLLG